MKATIEHTECSVGIDCSKTGIVRRGYCVKHYQRWYRTGDPLKGRLTLEERFWIKVDRSGDCWLWLGQMHHLGYGRFSLAPSQHVLSHRFAYELMVGPIPEGLELDHLCRNRACCNPDHLEPVTHLENMRRAAAWQKKEDTLI